MCSILPRYPVALITFGFFLACFVILLTTDACLLVESKVVDVLKTRAEEHDRLYKAAEESGSLVECGYVVGFRSLLHPRVLSLLVVAAVALDDHVCVFWF